MLYFSNVVDIFKYPRHQLIIGSLSNDDGDVNKNLHHAFLYISLPAARLWLVIRGGSKHKTTPLFLFLNFDTVYSTPKQIDNICRTEHDGISSATSLFLSDIFVAVAVRLLLKLPNKRGSKLLLVPDSDFCHSDNYLLFVPSLSFGFQILEATWPAATRVFLSKKEREPWKRGCEDKWLTWLTSTVKLINHRVYQRLVHRNHGIENNTWGFCVTFLDALSLLSLGAWNRLK